jgi:very-short-patch-repair endonuclease
MDAQLTKFARELRQNSTDAEKLFWSRVRDRRLEGLKFRRQYEVVGYIVDFVCTEAKLIVELDGGQHVASESDKARDARLMEEGYRVLRFWNNDVLLNIDGVIETVLKNLRQPSPQPSPSKGEGVQKRA